MTNLEYVELLNENGVNLNDPRLILMGKDAKWMVQLAYKAGVAEGIAQERRRHDNRSA